MITIFYAQDGCMQERVFNTLTEMIKFIVLEVGTNNLHSAYYDTGDCVVDLKI